jgi:hypothetical protein
VNVPEPLVLRIPKANIVYSMLWHAALGGLGIYVLVSRDSPIAFVAGALFVLLSLPRVVVGAIALRREDQSLTVRDDGLEVPELGCVTWSEITALTVDEDGLDLQTPSGHVHLGRLWGTTNTKDVRGEIASRSGGSWFSGQWRSRES